MESMRPTHPNAEAIKRFYKAFQGRDAEAMVAEYHPDVRFTDPVFQDLQGDRARGMWRMLVERAKDIELEFSYVDADDVLGSAHWEARYTFSATGRKVHNVIEARFGFLEGKIVEHIDSFDLWRWAGMALGPTGKLLGWASFVQNGIRKRAIEGLDAFMAR